MGRGGREGGGGMEGGGGKGEGRRGRGEVCSLDTVTYTEHVPRDPPSQSSFSFSSFSPSALVQGLSNYNRVK